MAVGRLGSRWGVAGRGRPPQAAARRAGLEFVEKLLTTNLTSADTTEWNAGMLRRIPLVASIVDLVGAPRRPGPPRHQGGVQWLAQSSAHRFLHELADPCLFGGGQLLQREGGRPHVALVEVRVGVKPNVAYRSSNFDAGVK
jgi:hypothetical protein